MSAVTVIGNTSTPSGQNAVCRVFSVKCGATGTGQWTLKG